MSRPLCAGLLAAALASAAGCQSEKSPYTFAPVEGTVRKDGQPLAGVVVVFWADADAGAVGPHSTGPTDSAGHYRLHTDQGVEGAVVGRHRVCILETGKMLASFLAHKPATGKLPRELPVPGPSVVPAGYGRREQTPLRAEVQHGPQVLDFDVK